MEDDGEIRKKAKGENTINRLEIRTSDAGRPSAVCCLPSIDLASVI